MMVDKGIIKGWTGMVKLGKMPATTKAHSYMNQIWHESSSITCWNSV